MDGIAHNVPAAQTQQQGPAARQDGHGGEACTSTAVAAVPKAASSRKKRKSCDFCTKRKRRCDGDGVNRCSLCIAKKQPECRYSVKLTTRPKATAAAASAPPPPREDFRRGSYALSTGGRSVDKALSDHRRLHDHHHDAASGSSVGGSFPSVHPLKRCRLSISPATGLVGLQENGYLVDFFGCLGFLPLANESIVREAMVNIMVAATAPPQQPETSGATGSQLPLPGHSIGQAGSRGDWGGAMIGRDLPNDPSGCILWCSIALGALVRGSPLDHVMDYVRLATDALGCCFDGGTVDTARAFISMAVLHNFLGDEAKNRLYLTFASNVVDALSPEELPVGLHDMLRSADKAWIFDVEPASVGSINQYWRDVLPVPKSTKVFHPEDLCGIFLAVDVRITQSLFEEHYGTAPDALVLGEGSKSFLRGGGGGGGGELAETSNARDRVEQEETEVGDAARLGPEDYLPPASSSIGEGAAIRFSRELLPEWLLLSRMAERPEVRLGVGGLLYYCNLACMQHEDPAESFKSIQRCVEVLTRYPGLSRYNVWLHTTHCLLLSLAMGECRDLYERLREACNSTAPEGALAVPPMEELKSMSDMCTHEFCRLMQCCKEGRKLAEVDDPSTQKISPSVDVAAYLLPHHEDPVQEMPLRKPAPPPHTSQDQVAVAQSVVSRAAATPDCPSPAGSRGGDMYGHGSVGHERPVGTSREEGLVVSHGGRGAAPAGSSAARSWSSRRGLDAVAAAVDDDAQSSLQRSSGAPTGAAGSGEGRRLERRPDEERVEAGRSTIGEGGGYCQLEGAVFSLPKEAAAFVDGTDTAAVVSRVSTAEATGPSSLLDFPWFEAGGVVDNSVLAPPMATSSAGREAAGVVVGGERGGGDGAAALEAADSGLVELADMLLGESDLLEN